MTLNKNIVSFTLWVLYYAGLLGLALALYKVQAPLLIKLTVFPAIILWVRHYGRRKLFPSKPLLKDFLIADYMEWKCSRCGATLVLHRPACSVCGQVQEWPKWTRI